MATEAPSSAKRRAMPAPIPRALPVTIATRPSKRPMFVFLLCSAVPTKGRRSL